LAKTPSRLKTVGFPAISRKPRPHDLLANCPDTSGPARTETPPQLAAADLAFAPPTAGHAPKSDPA
jgi:hypothetical protein